MNAFLILMVSAAFLAAILTAGKESSWGYRDTGATEDQNDNK